MENADRTFSALKAEAQRQIDVLVDLSFNFRLFVIPAEAGIQNKNWKIKLLDTRFRGYDRFD
jgi:hypothetical protein